MRRIVMMVMATALCSSAAMAQETMPIAGFEPDEASWGWSFSGGKVTMSLADDPGFDDVPSLEGDNALYVEYAAGAAGVWSNSTLSFEGFEGDLTGMRELHISFYFLPESEANPDGSFDMRFTIPNGLGLGTHSVPTAGEWHELVLPIDVYTSENLLDNVNQLQIVFMPGEDVDGRLYIDNIFAARPANAPSARYEMLYGFNETNADDGMPAGWENDAGDAPELGGSVVEPSEGSDYMQIPLIQGYTVNARTINAGSDFDEWEQVIAVVCDARMSEDFGGTWQNLQMQFWSSGGGAQTTPIRHVGSVQDEWRTVAWNLDVGPHLETIQNGGDFDLVFVTNNAPDAGGYLYIDNLRLALSASFTSVTRSLTPDQYEGGETFDVTLTVNNSEAGKEVTIEEMLPEGFGASSISDGGTEDGGVITWNLTLDEGETTLTYQATAPAQPESQGMWSGTVDGAEIRGENTAFFISPELLDTMVTVPRLSNEVTLDGHLGEDEYAGANTYSFHHDTATGNVAPGVHISGNEYPADEENVTFHVFHDETNIYVGFDVTDPSLNFEASDNAWQADSIELYFDGNLSRSSVKESNHLGPQLTVVGDGNRATSNLADIPVEPLNGGHMSEEGKDSEDGPVYWGFGAAPKEDGSGYYVEYRVDKAMILEPDNRERLGFDVLMNSSEEGTDGRTSKWGWHSTGPNGVVSEFWDDETGWGLMTLEGQTPVRNWHLY